MIAPGVKLGETVRLRGPGAGPLAAGAGPFGAGAGPGPATGVGLARSSKRPPNTFNGAVLPICGVEVLIVVVRPWVLADIHEANLFVVAFHERFRRTIVLIAQRSDGASRFYGPVEIVRVLQGLPLEMIPWRRLLFRTTPPPSWQLPIPQPRYHAPATATASVDPDDVVDIADGSIPHHHTTVR